MVLQPCGTACQDDTYPSLLATLLKLCEYMLIATGGTGQIPDRRMVQTSFPDLSIGYEPTD